MCLAAVAAAALACFAPPALGAAPTAAGFGRLGATPQRVRRHWTPARLGQAEPLAILDAGSPAAAADPAGEAAGARAGTPSARAATVPAAPGYVPAARPRENPASAASAYGRFPASANGALFGVFVRGLREEAYRCSASSVASGAGNLVLTAAHCVVDPKTGTVASWLVFIPAYHEGVEPFGEWAATEYGVTTAWAETAGTSSVSEGGDVAILRMQSRESDGASLQSVVGALGIAFNQPRNQVYTQFGYPAKAPYNGERLFEEVAEYEGADKSVTPATVGVSSDFTQGSSGGPWTTGGAKPVALSLTAYAYGTHSGLLFGPYFGAAAKSLYRRASDESSSEGSGNVSIRLGAIQRDDRAGTARLRVTLPAAGRVALRGGSLVAADVHTGRAKTLSLTLRANGSKLRTLRRTGSVSVTVTLTYRDEQNVGNRLRRTVKLVESG